MRRVVTIDCFPDCLPRYTAGWAVIAVDVFRATTTAVTAAARGRAVHPVPDLDRAVEVARLLDNPLLAGELGGKMPYGFEENNSPAAVDVRSDVDRPMVLLSSSGTQLLADVGLREAVYAACLRNLSAQVAHAAVRHERIAVVGAGTRGEFREEDQMCCAWLAEGFISAGYEPLGWTESIVHRWRDAPVSAAATGNSADYLRRSGQTRDLDFVLRHLDDVPAVFRLSAGRLVMELEASAPRARAATGYESRH